MTRTCKHRGAPAGFTLIEVMIVIAIILVLSGLVGYAVFGRQKQAKEGIAAIELNTIKGAMRQFRLDFDRYPTDEESVAVLWDKELLSSDADTTKWSKYLEEPLPNDRWGTPWGYRAQSEHGDENMYDLWSAGPDKQEGTEDDINSWKSEEELADTGANSGAGSSKGPNP